REETLLRRWGYPHVLDCFRFHFSLTGSLREHDAAEREALRRDAAAEFEAGGLEPPLADHACIFEEPAPAARFRLIHRSRFGRIGRLVYVVGPSGAGKDSLLAWARERLPEKSGVRFAQRTITRAADAGGEAHRAVTEEEFDALLAQDAFALHWQANGLRYGVGREIEAWLAEGATVVVNGSREHEQRARQKFPQLQTVHVGAPPGVLKLRLAARGRENPQIMQQRLARSDRLRAMATDAGADLELLNHGPLDRAGTQLTAFLCGRQAGRR
ncbi:MAG: phosphonate metabolism protein/1,5-bisphosphokinase (PRPP-forming) PhnN, partial [Candidatus Parcubacteria bacterium]|nr:phosphonate metabolism protein/1,5-bisphosphokinase (PRPP-forming) PhnN [Burkholderiales bacterium]